MKRWDGEGRTYKGNAELGYDAMTPSTVHRRMLLTAYASYVILFCMSWAVGFHPAFDEEFENLTDAVQEKLYAHAEVLEHLDQRWVARGWTR